MPKGGATAYGSSHYAEGGATEVYYTVIRDITERDRRQKFRPNQNVLRDVTSRWSMRITAHSSDS